MVRSVMTPVESIRSRRTRKWAGQRLAVLALVSFARIYLGAHAPLDVIGGVGVGLIVGGAANLTVGVERRETRYEGLTEADSA